MRARETPRKGPRSGPSVPTRSPFAPKGLVAAGVVWLCASAASAPVADAETAPPAPAEAPATLSGYDVSSGDPQAAPAVEPDTAPGVAQEAPPPVETAAAPAVEQDRAPVDQAQDPPTEKPHGTPPRKRHTVRAQEQHGAGVGKRYGRPADKQDSAAVGKQQDARAGTEQDAPGGNPEDAPAADDDTGPAAGTQAGAHAEQARGRAPDEPQGPAADKQHGGPDDQGDAATSRADAPAADPGDDETELRDTDEPGDARAHYGTGTPDAGAPADAEPAPAPPAFTPTLPLPSLALTAPLPGVPPNSGHAALHVLPKTSSRKFEAVALSSETPGSLVRSWLRPAVRASVPFEPAELSVAPEQRAMSSARAAHENSVTRDPSDLRLPGVPGAPDNSGCVSSTSCATANPLAIVPLLGALGCLCALLFERLLGSMHPWRLQGFLSLHERPG